MKEEGVRRVSHHDTESLLTAKEVADFMHVHVASVGRWSRQGNIKFYRVGFRGDMRFAMKDVMHFLKESRRN